MNILFFGYGSHARKLKKCCEDYFKFSTKPKFIGIRRSKIKADIEIFNSIEEVLSIFSEINCVFISANNSSHLDIFKKCIQKKIKFIYVEKPAIGVQDFFENLGNEKQDLIKYIQVGYHMSYAEAFLQLREIINNKKFGELIRLDMFLGHGLAFKEGFEESWRAKEKNALIDTVLSHLINLSINLNNSDTFKDFKFISKLNEKNNKKDTEHLSFNNINGALFSLTSSWGSPLEKSVKAYFSNGIWEYNFKELIIKYPRDNFNSDGFFITPIKNIRKCEFLGIKPSVDHFLDQVIKNKYKKNQFNNSFYTNKILEEVKKKNNED